MSALPEEAQFTLPPKDVIYERINSLFDAYAEPEVPRQMARDAFEPPYDAVATLQKRPEQPAELGTAYDLRYVKVIKLSTAIKDEFDRLVQQVVDETRQLAPSAEAAKLRNERYMKCLQDCAFLEFLNFCIDMHDYLCAGFLIIKFLQVIVNEKSQLTMPLMIPHLLRLMRAAPEIFHRQYNLFNVVGQCLSMCATSWSVEYVRELVDNLTSAEYGEDRVILQQVGLFIPFVASRAPLEVSRFVNFKLSQFQYLDMMGKQAFLGMVASICRLSQDYSIVQDVPRVLLSELTPISDDSFIMSALNIISQIATSPLCDVYVIPFVEDTLLELTAQSIAHWPDMPKGFLIKIFSTILAQISVDQRQDLQRKIFAKIDEFLPDDMHLNMQTPLYLTHLYSMTSVRGSALMPQSIINKIEKARLSMDPNIRTQVSALLQQIHAKHSPLPLSSSSTSSSSNSSSSASVAATGGTVASSIAPKIKLKITHEHLGMQPMTLNLDQTAPKFNSFAGKIVQLFGLEDKEDIQGLVYKDEDGDSIQVRNDQQLDELFNFLGSNPGQVLKISLLTALKPQKVQTVASSSASEASSEIPSTSSASPASPAEDSQDASQIKWRKGRLLGKGGFGSVYEGINLETGELMAVKIIRLPSVSKMDEEHFMRELRVIQRELVVMQRLEHPNIVRYIGAAREGENLLVFQEFVPGGSLQSVLKTFGSLNEVIVRRYLKQMLMGLDYLHENHVIHRDLKAGNVLLDQNGSIRLADFGAAKLVGDVIDAQEKHSIRGTPLFLSPEAVSKSQFGAASDIWALGCTVIELLTGRPPLYEQYKNLNEYQVLYQLAHLRKPVDLSSFGLSPALKDMLDRCFELDPANRPSCKQLLQHEFFVGTSDVNSSKASSVAVSPAASLVAAAVTPAAAEPSAPAEAEADDNDGGDKTMYETFDSISSAVATGQTPSSRPSAPEDDEEDEEEAEEDDEEQEQGDHTIYETFASSEF